MSFSESEARSFRQGEKKRGSFIHLGFGPDAPAMTLDDSLNDGEADPSAFKFLLVVQSLKDAEKSIRISHFKPRSVVPNKVNSFPFLLTAAYFDKSAGLVAREFVSIREQIDKNLFEQRCISDTIRESSELHLNLPVGLFRWQFSEHLPNQIGDAHGLFG